MWYNEEMERKTLETNNLSPVEVATLEAIEESRSRVREEKIIRLYDFSNMAPEEILSMFGIPFVTDSELRIANK